MITTGGGARAGTLARVRSRSAVTTRKALGDSDGGFLTVNRGFRETPQPTLARSASSPSKKRSLEETFRRRGRFDRAPRRSRIPRTAPRIASARPTPSSPAHPPRPDFRVRAATPHASPAQSRLSSPMSALASAFSLKAAAAASLRRVAPRRDVTVRANAFEMPSTYKKVRRSLGRFLPRSSSRVGARASSEPRPRTPTPADNVCARASDRRRATETDPFLPHPLPPRRRLPPSAIRCS